MSVGPCRSSHPICPPTTPTMSAFVGLVGVQETHGSRPTSTDICRSLSVSVGPFNAFQSFRGPRHSTSLPTTIGREFHLMAGYGKPQRPNRRLTSEAPRLPVSAIPKFGTVTLTWPQNLASALHAGLTRTRAGLVIETGSTSVEVKLCEWPMPTVRGRQRGVRTRFACPRCDASRDVLHWINGEWGCRGKNCLDISHACRHRQRYCPAIARRERLRRKLIRTRPKSLKARALRKMIAREGRAMLAHLERVNRDLTKRSRRHARHGRVGPE